MMGFKNDVIDVLLIAGGITLIRLADQFLGETFLGFLTTITLTVIGAGLLIYYGRRSMRK